MVREIEEEGSKGLRNDITMEAKKNKLWENEDSSRRRPPIFRNQVQNGTSREEKAREPWNNIDEKGGERVCNHETCKCINHSTPGNVFILDFLL